MQVYFRNCTHILKRTQRKKFEDMFLVKIANKGTSLTLFGPSFFYHLDPDLKSQEPLKEAQ